ncbi:MAG: DapH/DapD/GlmU-related protein [Clostridiaceae bacterium]
MNNYISTNEQNLIVGENVVFSQQTIFNGDGSVVIGDNVMFGYYLAPHFYGFHELIQARTKESSIKIGNNTKLSNDITLISVKSIEVGENCLIGDRVTIYDFDGHELNPLERTNSEGKSGAIIIGNNVWIGSMVTILKGVSIGENSIVGANSVVTNNIPKNSIVVGNPARIVKNLKDLDLSSKEKLIKYITNLINSDNLDNAKKLINKYKEENQDDDIEIISMDSVVKIKENNLEEAEKLLKQGLEISDNFDLKYNIAYVYELKGQFVEAQYFYELAEKICDDINLKEEIRLKLIDLYNKNLMK